MPTLDRLSDDWGVQADLVKIDVEGAEREALSGARAFVSENSPRIMVEMHAPPELPMADNARSVLDWCDETDYSAWYLAKHEPLRTPDQIAHRGRCHLLLQPSGLPYPSGLDQVTQGASIASVLATG